MKRIALSFIFLAAFFALPRWGMTQAGVTSANFLKIGMGARASAMADSFTAVSDDATAIYWNPAGLYQAQGTQLSLTHSVWLQGVDIDFIALSQNLGSAGALGLGFTTLSLQPFQSTVEDSSGIFNGFGPTVNANDWELSLGYSNLLSRFLPGRIFDNTLFGLSVNVVGQNESGPTGTAFSMTGGVIQLFPDQHFSLGLELTNLGTVIQERSQPLDLKMGLAWYHLRTFNSGDKWTFAGDLDLNNDTGFQPSFGSEYRLPLDHDDIGFLRAGLRTTDDEFGLSFITLGAGLEHNFGGFLADLDYAYVPYGTLGPTHRITLSIKLGEEKKIKAEISAPESFKLEDPKVKLSLKSHADDPVADWTLQIKDAKGQLVRKITGKGEPPADYLWNARDENEMLVPAGTYNATLQVKDIAGRQSTTDAVYFKAIAPLSLENVQWALSSDAVFAIAQAELLPGCKAYLNQMTLNLRKYFKDFGVTVEGHTDSSPCRLGPHCHFANNQLLSEARAQAVKNLMVELGMDTEDVSVQGYAEMKPVATNETPEGRSKNRRIEIKIISRRKATAQKVTNAGIFLLVDGQYPLAAQMFQNVIDNAPDIPEPHRYLINCYQKMGDGTALASAEAEGKKYGGAMPEPFSPLPDHSIENITPEPTIRPLFSVTPLPTRPAAVVTQEPTLVPQVPAASVPTPVASPAYSGHSW